MRILLTVIFTYLFSNLYAIDFSNLNTAYWYESNPAVDFTYRAVSDGDDFIVFLKLKSSKLSQISATYFLQETFEDKNEVEFSGFILDTLENQNDEVFLKMSFKKISDFKLLVVRIFDLNNYFYFPVALSRGALRHPSFYPVDQQGLPILEDFVSENEIMIRDAGSGSKFYFFQYREAFPPADPPMGITQSVNPTLNVDSVFTASLTNVILQDNYFYFIQEDTLSTLGLTLFSGSDFFPEYRTIEELISPVTYFSKSSEMGNLLNNKSPKLAFDRFWLSLFMTKNRAKAAIANYYRKVWSANKHFTDYKQGWKTDRGIIYLVFGSPKEVYRKNQREIWVYDNAQFEFRIISNLFAPELYIMIRDKDYESIWYDQVQNIRGGK